MKENNELAFAHRFIPTGREEATLLLLHGTGGDENDLVPLARDVSRSAAILSPRGKVLENGMARYFRRLAEGVLDVEDLKFRTHELAQFVKTASRMYSFNLQRVVALGYSNGANIAASLLLLHPDTLAGAILMRPMVPLVPDNLLPLGGKPVLILAGRSDRIIPSKSSEDLDALLSRAGAKTTLQWTVGDHGLSEEDVTISRDWFLKHFATKK